MTEEKDDEKSFEKKRRNLMILSTIILIYELGEGTIEKLSIPGGSINLAKPKVAIYFTWLVFVYFLWRFWQVAQPKHREIGRAFKEHLKKDNQFIRLAVKHYEELEKKAGMHYSHFNRYNKESDRTKYFTYSPQEEIIVSIVNIDHTKIPFERVLSFGSIQYKNEDIAELKGWTINDRLEVLVKIPFSTFFIIQSKVFSVTLIKHISFSDVYLPYLYWLFSAGVVFHNNFHI